uniref:Protein quiver n=1 Tax=Plectus sambesii TaxID=2011161 RepID=A0A914XDI6_9BILA
MLHLFQVTLLFACLDCFDRVLSDSAIECYGCATSLPATTDFEAKTAMKLLIKNNYNLPEVHKVCSEPGDQEFPTIPHLECPIGDQCVKITVNQQDQRFVIRGCRATMFKPNITPQDYPCDDRSSPSICYCDQALCNRSLLMLAADLAANTAAPLLYYQNTVQLMLY